MTDFFRKKLWTQHALWVAMLLVGGVVGWFINWALTTPTQNDTNAARRIVGKYEFISPLISCDYSETREPPALVPIKKSLDTVIREQKTAGAVTDVSVYFRDLFAAQWIGVDENVEYWPASLMKVPVLVSALKSVETQPELLMHRFKVTWKDDDNINEFFKPANPLVQGREYSLQELLEAMVRGSDNNATVATTNIMDKQSLIDVFGDMGIQFPPKDNSTEYLSAKSYAYFFRILFNASYINRGLSEFALGLLSQSEFKNGLVAGVPATVRVAHKFGERNTPDNKLSAEPRELHDCGIVYYPDHPYLLCVMTRGTDMNKMAGAIQAVSASTYSAWDAQHKK